MWANLNIRDYKKEEIWKRGKIGHTLKRPDNIICWLALYSETLKEREDKPDKWQHGEGQWKTK